MLCFATNRHTSFMFHTWSRFLQGSPAIQQEMIDDIVFHAYEELLGQSHS